MYDDKQEHSEDTIKLEEIIKQAKKLQHTFNEYLNKNPNVFIPSKARNLCNLVKEISKLKL